MRALRRMLDRQEPIIEAEAVEDDEEETAEWHEDPDWWKR